MQRADTDTVMALLEKHGLNASSGTDADLHDPGVFTGSTVPAWVGDDDIVDQLLATGPPQIGELWRSGHGPGTDKSANNFSVAMALARLVGPDVDRTQRILQSNEKIKRPKWDTHRNYLERTIRKAIIAVHNDPDAPRYVWPASRATWTAHMRRKKTSSYDVVDHPAGDVEPGLYLVTQSGGGNVERVQLTNFPARIVASVAEDDGAKRKVSVCVEATVNGIAREVRVPVTEYSAMGWVIAELGPDAIVAAGHSAKDHARAAIQHVSTDIQTLEVYTHGGWRMIDGKHTFLSGGSSITRDGVAEGIEVSLPDDLQGYQLPSPPDSDERVAAVRLSLELWLVADASIMAPTLGVIYTAPIRIKLSARDTVTHGNSCAKVRVLNAMHQRQEFPHVQYTNRQPRPAADPDQGGRACRA